MRTMWNAFSFIAVVNILAILLLIAWLWQSKRLDLARVETVRQLLAVTIPEEQAALTAAEKAAEEELLALQIQDRGENPPLPSGVQIEFTSLLRRQTNQTIRRLEEEKRLLNAQLARNTAQIEQERKEFESARQSWEASIEADLQQKIDEQFAKVVKQLESIPAKQAKQILLELVSQNQMEQAVAYFDAMNPRASAKVLKEFKSEMENEMAVDLLEELRVYGIGAETAETSADANGDPANTAS